MRKGLMVTLALVMALTMVLGLVGMASAAKPAPAGYYCLGNHYYRLVSSTMSWTNARNAAASENVTIGNRVFYGHLVIITSARENAFVASFFTWGTTGAWIGAYQPTSGPEPDGGWAWVTDTVPWDYTNWTNGEPNDAGGEDYAEIYPSGSWNDCSNTNYKDYYIVEYER